MPIARLLDGYWPQFLVANVPLAQTHTPVASRPRGTQSPSTPAPSRKTIFVETIKGYLPRSWQQK